MLDLEIIVEFRNYAWISIWHIISTMSLRDRQREGGRDRAESWDPSDLKRANSHKTSFIYTRTVIEFIHILLQFKEKSKSKISIIDTKNRKIHCVLRKNSKFIHKHVDIELDQLYWVALLLGCSWLRIKLRFLCFIWVIWYFIWWN